ncbi:unnamed protein product [Rotaria magnacalcarata]|uniref:Uncharacterized protein n=2 Tax=Rotaria magnacalcarata TaxID=392030 RepID=A0A816LEB6_9BILA|nr:unnamed protein product [Rotaria magnacalcarata]CAF1552044.1 unnamed protein product [Rotaria magnacalcarata]CAF1930106.1 unnamed protein product [Rotaria magnacalcarata]CAF1960576.1 unnamed protein product [Rotaria magnacalcarata]CAF2161763.1 unnamed protein product [Rotaria magnacalcarata]
MTVCRVILFGLKPCDISSCTNNKISETSLPQRHSLIPVTTSTKFQLANTKENTAVLDTDYLNLVIKPSVTSNNLHSSTSNDTGHEASPIRLKIHENSRGRHRICVSQTLLRTHTGDA